MYLTSALEYKFALTHEIKYFYEFTQIVTRVTVVLVIELMLHLVLAI